MRYAMREFLTRLIMNYPFSHLFPTTCYWNWE
jgi:hypothetical protein